MNQQTRKIPPMNKGDYLTYRKAVSISIIGLLLQLGLTLVVFFYSRISGDYAAGGAATFLATGLIAWGLLLLVFDQHRRERMESMEAEQLAVSGSSAASAFDTVGDDLHIAARRLAFSYKWIVPGGAILIGIINIWVGVGRLSDWRSFSSNESFVYQPSLVGWALAIGIALAVVGFVFARFVSGMGKVDAWANLRAGSAISVAAALIGVVMAVGGFLELAVGIHAFVLWSPMIIPIGMIIFGIEIGLNLLLDVYRPRKPGEVPRPAFDSRLLGLLAAPDRIAENVGEAVNYQFGIDVTSTWFYQLLSRWIAGFIIAGVAVGWLMSSLVVVEPHERGLIITNGVISKPLFSLGGDTGEGDVGPGLHVKWPWPISRYETPLVVSVDGDDAVQTTTGVRILNLASHPPTPGSTPILWTESHTGVERLNIVRPQLAVVSDSDDGVQRETSSVAELSLLAVEVPVHYVIRNVKLFDQFAAPGQRENMLKQLGQRVVTQYLGELSINEILATHRTQMPLQLKTRLEDAYGQLNGGEGTGIEILFVGINGVHPPTKVAPSFERVISALQNRESLIEEAKKFQVTTLTEIAGTVDLAQEINDKLVTLEDTRRAYGSGSSEYTAAEFEVQKLIERAGGEAGELILAAGASRWVRHMSERGRASLLQGQQEAYLASPELYRSNMYFSALLEAMKESRVYLTPADLESLKVRLELQDKQVGTDVFDAEAGAESQ